MRKPPGSFGLLCAGVLVVVPTPAEAFELSGGVSVGGIQIGTDPRLAASTFVGLLWTTEKSFLFGVYNMFSLIPGARVGVYDRTAATIGYASKTVNVSFGPSLSVYSMPACAVVICSRVMGFAPGGHARTDWYFTGPLGVSVSANMDWAGGSSRVLPGGWVAMVTAGPILRAQARSK